MYIAQALLLTLIPSIGIASNSSAWIPIYNDSLTTFIPAPAVQVEGVGVYSSGDEQRIKVGEIGATTAFYYRSIDIRTGQADAWQCSTSEQVKQNGDVLIASAPINAGQYKYEVSACMTGSNCDVSQFSQGKLACSGFAATNTTQVASVAGVRVPSATDSNDEHIGTIAAQFRVTESGAATYSIPIATPKGTAGVQPQVALTYSSQAGASVVGQGWNISAASAITRCGKTPVYDGVQGGINLTNSDRLCFNGQRLLKNRTANSKYSNDIGISDTSYWSSSAVYHTAIDSFNVVKPYYSNGSLRAFTVENKAGEVHYYGDLSAISSSKKSLLNKPLARGFYLSSGAFTNGRSDAYIHSKESTSKAIRWLVKGVEDVTGNYFVYNYTSSVNSNASFYNSYSSHTGQSYLKSIEYTGNSRDSKVRPYAKIEFDYKENKKRSMGWIAGSPYTQAALLEKINVTIDGKSFRTYIPSYYESDYLDEKNYLLSLKECQGSICNAPLSFEWKRPAPITTTTKKQCTTEDIYAKKEPIKMCFDAPVTDPFKPFSTTNSKNISSRNNDRALFFDFDGDGFADIVYPDGSWKVKYGPSFTRSETISRTSYLTNNAQYARVMDVDGDGVLDFIVASSKTANWQVVSSKKITKQFTCPIWALNPANSNKNCEPVTYSVNVEDLGIKAVGLEGQTQIMDVDGDSLQDIVYSSGVKFHYYKNLGNRKFAITSQELTTIPTSNRGSTGPIFDPDEPITITHRLFNGDSRYKRTAGAPNATLLDFNGDGITDLLVGRNTEIKTCKRDGMRPRSIAMVNTDSLSNEAISRIGGMRCTSQYDTDWFLYSGSNWSSPAQTFSGYAFKEPKVVDLNGDGLSDIIWRNGNNLNYRLSSGKQLLTTKVVKVANTNNSSILNFTDEQEDYSYFLDVSSDGMTDLLISNTTKTDRTTYFARPSMSNPEEVVFQKRGTWSFDKNKMTQFADVNGDGKIDLLQGDSSKWQVYLSKEANQLMNVITSVDNGHGITNNITYSGITSTYDNFTNDVVATYIQKESTQGLNSDGTRHPDYFSPKTGMFMVSRVDSLSNYGENSSVVYQYGGLLLHKKGYGNLGFEILRTIDVQTCGTATNRQSFIVGYDDDKTPLYGYRNVAYTNYDDCVVTTTQYNQLAPYTGIPKSTVQTIGVGDDAILMSNATNSVGSKGTTNGGMQTYISSSTQKSYAPNAELTASTLVSRTVTSTIYDYDGNTTNLTTYTDARDTGGKDPSNNKTIITSNSYGSSSLDKKMGRLSSSTVTKYLVINGIKAPVNGKAGNLVKTASFTYNTDKMLKTETSSFGTTTHGYDKFGNRTSSSFVATDARGNDSNTRATSSDYDSRGRYVISTTNANNFTTLTHYQSNNSSSFNNLPKGIISAIRTTDENGAQSNQYFKAFGRAYKQTSTMSAQSPTLVAESFTRKCSSVKCGVAGAFQRVISVSSGGAESQTYLDTWGREIATKKRLMDGTWQVIEKTYDSLGRAKSVSEPNRNVASSYKTSYEYDRLGRVETETIPTGHTITRQYSGKQVTTKDQKGNKQRITTNFVGQKVAVEQLSSSNALLTKLTYSYNVANQLISAKVYAGSQYSHTQVTNTYNTNGQKVTMNDLDKGQWRYDYNAFDELVSQTNSSSQTVALRYDRLGRKIARLDVDGLTCWEYDTQIKGSLSRVAYQKGAGQNTNTCSNSWPSNPNYEEAYTYGHNLKVASTKTVIDGETFYTEQMYDEYNRVKYTQYPANGFTIEHGYNSYGVPTTLKNATVGHRDYGKIYQEAKAMDARGNIIDIRYANGAKQTKRYKSNTGFIESMLLTKGYNVLDSQSFVFDVVGNLEQRSHNFAYGGSSQDFCEKFTYDDLYRLRTAKTTTRSSVCSNSGTINKTYSYDALGNIKHKTGLGYYTYDSTKKNRLLKVTSGANGSGTTYYNFTGNRYDNRGNVLNDGNRAFTYASYDKPTRISKGGIYTSMEYDHNRNLYKRVDGRSDGITETLYVKGLYERIKGSNGITEHKYFAGNIVVTDRSNGTFDTFYLHKDHLGSTTTITNASGAVVQHINYDAWGKQNRFHTNSSLVSLLKQQSPAESKGYTGHKELSDLGIIHMNGRIYDPTLGRFLQADPFIQAPMNSQNYNRYSYVLNNPLRYTDPSGYNFLESIAKPFKKIGRSIMKALGPKISGWLVNIGSAWCGPYYAACVAAGNYEIARSQGASSTGALRSGATAGVMAYVGQQANAQWGYGSWQSVATQATAGGVMADLNGGKFGHGFWAAGYNAFQQGPNSGAAYGQNLNSFGDYASSLGNYLVNSYTQEEVGRFANRNGMTATELNIYLSLLSYGGNQLTGTRYRGETDGVERIDGLGRRFGWLGGDYARSTGFNPYGVAFDLVDIVLGYQGYYSASSFQYATSGNLNAPLMGYSLGALDVNVLASKGFGWNGVTAVSLPFGNVGMSRVSVINGKTDPVNGGWFGYLFTPSAMFVDGGLACHMSYCYDVLGTRGWNP